MRTGFRQGSPYGAPLMLLTGFYNLGALRSTSSDEVSVHINLDFY